MLVLTRREGESIAIGDEIEVTVLEIRGRNVRLGIKAPPEMPVHRLEVYLRIQGKKTAGPLLRRRKLFLRFKPMEV